ncbi:MAG: hypothetical protein NC827_06855 [Candidatus Omnitrophica bacterium]|nr:hypothetical protein [Candidatus Omnitrophota bacterium]MCM8803009.1 hypothetical protein [Candidatus Omnitrophota bacterium]
MKKIIYLFFIFLRIVFSSDYIWIEGENPEKSNFKLNIWSGKNPQILSNGSWATCVLNKEDIPAKLPKEGIIIEYDFKVLKQDDYDLWLRIGYEWARAPLEWKIDDNDWQILPSDAQTTNVIEVDFWCEVAWIKVCKIKLNEGNHKITFRLKELNKERLIWGIDCIAFIKGDFLPDGKLKPNEIYNDEIDIKARDNIFKIDYINTNERQEFSLNGIWEIARYDDPDMDTNPYEPEKEITSEILNNLKWRGIEVPGDAWKRQELTFGHRIIYRTKLEVPKQIEDKSFILHFSGTNWIVSVFVNGKYIGGHRSVLVPWNIDITEGIIPGKINEIVLIVKGPYYAIDYKSLNTSDLDHTRNRPKSVFRNTFFIAPVYPSTKGEGDGTQIGLIFPVKLIIAGKTYISDIFVKTFVKDKKIEIEYEIKNNEKTEKNLEIQPVIINKKTGEIEKTIEPVKFSISALNSKNIKFEKEWENAKLWWPERNPDLYILKTTIKEEDREKDIHQLQFGFREVSIEGRHFLLNGIKWHFWNWVDVPRVETKEEWLAEYEKQNDRFHRIAYDHDKIFGCREEALKFFDENGIPGRLSTCIDGMFITYNLDNPVVWEHFKEHIYQVVKAYRNHPSIMMWSLENELLLINAFWRHWNTYKEIENQCAELIKIQEQLDPTRKSIFDGGGDVGGYASINCQHYTWPSGEPFPIYAYNYPEKKELAYFGRTREIYNWDKKKPLILGEVFFYGGNPNNVIWIGGPEVYRGRDRADIYAAKYARICIEGARWQEVTGISPWVRGLPYAEKSFSPKAVFIREHNSCFFSGGELKKTIRIFNDDKQEDNLTLQWQLLIDEKIYEKGQKTFKVKGGEYEEDILKIQLPILTKRTDGKLILKLLSNNKPVFEDEKNISILPKISKVSFRNLNSKNLFVYDLEGKIKDALKLIEQNFYILENFNTIPQSLEYLIIGSNSINKENRKIISEKIKALLKEGKKIVIFEQETPLEKNELPVNIEISKQTKKPTEIYSEFKKPEGTSGSICFPVALSHPVLEGLKQDDFFTWIDDYNFKVSYKTPEKGVISIIQAGDDLNLTPMLEIIEGNGSLILCQLLVGEKFEKEPVAQKILYNILAYFDRIKERVERKFYISSSEDQKLKDFIKLAGIKFEEKDRFEDLNENSIYIIKGTKENLKNLINDKNKLENYFKNGNYLVIFNIDDKSINEFNNLVEFNHRIRKFRKEKILIEDLTEPLLLGLTDRDFSMFSEEVLAPWINLNWISDKVFTNIVDGKEIASFGGESSKVIQVTNGLTNEDFWRYVQYLNADGDSIEFNFKKPEVITEIKVKPTSGPYYKLKDIEIIFDDNINNKLLYTCSKEGGFQNIKLKQPTKCSKIRINNINYWPGKSTQNLVGIDIVEIYRKVDKLEEGEIKPLTKPAGIVKYRKEKGGILLIQIDYTSPDKKENMSKKINIVSNILRNLGQVIKNEGI